eukprot:m.137385 g.137385  ORF g.137385 m.137385 type:complete len:53 (-) comp29918_c0_seq1:112-270(-)
MHNRQPSVNKQSKQQDLVQHKIQTQKKNNQNNETSIQTKKLKLNTHTMFLSS